MSNIHAHKARIFRQHAAKLREQGAKAATEQESSAFARLADSWDRQAEAAEAKAGDKPPVSPKITVMEAEPTLHEMQVAVGGYIEVIPGFTRYNGKKCAAICNEEGKLKRLEVNVPATELWREQCSTTDVLVGDICIIMGGLK